MNYQDINAKTIDLWCEDGWQWGKAISHEEYQKALMESILYLMIRRQKLKTNCPLIP